MAIGEGKSTMRATPEQRAHKTSDTALAIITEELEALGDWSIRTPDESEFAAEMLQDVKARHKALEAERKKITGPLNAATKAVNDLFRKPRTLLERAERTLKDKIKWFLEKQASENAAAFKAAAEADTADEAREVLATIDQTLAPKGVSINHTWKAVVFSPGIVPDDFRMPDCEKIQAYTNEAVKRTGEPIPIPGVKFEKVSVVTSRKVKK